MLLVNLSNKFYFIIIFSLSVCPVCSFFQICLIFHHSIKPCFLRDWIALNLLYKYTVIPESVVCFKFCSIIYLPVYHLSSVYRHLFIYLCHCLYFSLSPFFPPLFVYLYVLHSNGSYWLGSVFVQVVNFDCELCISLGILSVGILWGLVWSWALPERVYICFCQLSGISPTQNTFKFSTCGPWGWTGGMNSNCKPGENYSVLTDSQGKLYFLFTHIQGLDSHVWCFQIEGFIPLYLVFYTRSLHCEDLGFVLSFYPVIKMGTESLLTLENTVKVKLPLVFTHLSKFFLPFSYELGDVFKIICIWMLQF